MHRWIESVQLVSIALTACLIGCAAQLISPPEHNYALAIHGSEVIGTRAVMGSADALIDGVVDPSLWNEGVGWEATFTRGAISPVDLRATLSDETNYDLRRGPLDRRSLGSAWVELQFAEPRKVSRVVIHALDTEELPFRGIINAELRVRSSNSPASVWRTVASVEKGRILVRGQLRGETGPKSIFRFPAETVEAIRLDIYETGDSELLPSDGNGRRRIDSVRLLEIEVNGTEALDLVEADPRDRSELADEEPAPARATVGLKAPDISLTDPMTDATRRLYDYRSRVVLVYFFQPMSDPSAIIDLKELDAAFDDPEFVILGVSMERTDGRMTEEVIERYRTSSLSISATRRRWSGMRAWNLLS